MSTKKDPVPVIEGNDLFDLDIFEKYSKEKVLPPPSISDKFDYDVIDENSEFWLFRVPADFDISKLNGKSVSIGEGTFPLLSGSEENCSEQWELHSEQLSASSTSDLKEIDLLLPIKAMDGAIALAPFGPSRAITVTRKINVENPIKKAKKLRDAPYVPPTQSKDLKYRFHPYGFFTNEGLDVSKEPTPQSKSSKKLSGRKSTALEDGTTKEAPKKKKRSKDSDETGSSKPKAKKKKSGKQDQ